MVAFLGVKKSAKYHDKDNDLLKHAMEVNKSARSAFVETEKEGKGICDGKSRGTNGIVRRPQGHNYLSFTRKPVGETRAFQHFLR